MIVSGGEDGSVKIWDVQRSDPLIKEFPGHGAPISAVEVGEYGHFVVSGGDEGKLKLYSLGKPLHLV